jgi:hypothetical protein
VRRKKKPFVFTASAQTFKASQKPHLIDYVRTSHSDSPDWEADQQNRKHLTLKPTLEAEMGLFFLSRLNALQKQLVYCCYIHPSPPPPRPSPITLIAIRAHSIPPIIRQTLIAKQFDSTQIMRRSYAKEEIDPQNRPTTQIALKKGWLIWPISVTRVFDLLALHISVLCLNGQSIAPQNTSKGPTPPFLLPLFPPATLLPYHHIIIP